ncbi:MAG: LamG domain-containing protein [Patescibacteria group bacterium]|jgi:hypothetical protein
MKIALNNKKIGLIIFLVGFFILVIAGISWADNFWDQGYQVNPGGTADVVIGSEAGDCYKIINNSTNNYFIPTKTQAEWEAFSSHLPSGLSVESCSSMPTPVMELHFNDGPGATFFTDSSGNNNHGSCTGGNCPTWTTDGGGSGAYIFDGTTDYVTVADSNSLDITDQLTMSAWIKTSSSLLSYILSKNYAQQAYAMYLDASHIRVVLKGQFISMPISIVIPLNKWVHLALTRDGSVAKFYVNGEERYSFANSGLLPANALRLLIGARDDATLGTAKYWNGILDEIMLWNVALTSDEIQEILMDSPPPGVWLTSSCDVGANLCGSGTRDVWCTQENTCNEGEKPSTSCTVGCQTGATCVSGSCVCTPHTSTTCYGGDVYWMNSCNVREELKQDCTGSETCSYDSATSQYICKPPTWHCGTTCNTWYVAIPSLKVGACPGAVCSPSEGTKYATWGYGSICTSPPGAYLLNGACGNACPYNCSGNLCIKCIDSCSCY